jgi:Zn-dependent M32 family carboxypeptidase
MNNEEISLQTLEAVEKSLKELVANVRTTMPPEIVRQLERPARKSQKAIARAKNDMESLKANFRTIYRYHNEMAEICERAWPDMEFRRLGQELQSTGSKA